MHIAPPPKLTSMRGLNLASTPSSPSFADWYKCGSRTRDTRFTRPLLYPSELTCGGMKQSGRAVRDRATRSGTQSHQVGLRTHCRCTIDVSTSSRDPAIRSLKSSISFLTTGSHRPKRRNPGRQCLPGSLRRDRSGDCHLVSPATHAKGLTHHDFQGARGGVAGIHEIPCVDLQRRALPRAKRC
jgi:hypothetical protein